MPAAQRSGWVPRAEQGEEAAPRPAGDERALRVDDPLGDQRVVDGAHVLELGEPRAAGQRVAPGAAVADGPAVVDVHDGVAGVDVGRPAGAVGVVVEGLGTAVHQKGAGVRARPLGAHQQRVDVAARTGDPAVLDRIGGGRLLLAHRENDGAVGPPDHRRPRGGGPGQLHGAVGTGGGAADDARRGVQLLQVPGGQLVAVQLGARGGVVPDQQRRTVGVPAGGDVAGQVEHDLGLGAGSRRPRPAAPRGRAARDRPAAAGRRAAGRRRARAGRGPRRPTSRRRRRAAPAWCRPCAAPAAPGTAGRRARSATSRAARRPGSARRPTRGRGAGRSPAASRPRAPATARCRRRWTGPPPTNRRPTSRPAGYAGSTSGRATASSPPAKGWVCQMPNSSPSVSANHQTVSPSGLSVALTVPLGRSVTCRCVPDCRSQAYCSTTPLMSEAYRQRCGASRAHSGSDTRGARNRACQRAVTSGGRAVATVGSGAAVGSAVTGPSSQPPGTHSGAAGEPAAPEECRGDRI